VTLGQAESAETGMAPGTGTVTTQMGGVRAGVIVLVGFVLANAGNYAFQLLTARELGPLEYGDVATLSALTLLIGLPLGGVQVFVARHVARDTGHHGVAATGAFLRGFTSACALAGAALAIALLALAPVVKSALSILNIWAIVFTAVFAVPAFLFPPVLGAAQGLQRFRLVSVAMAAPSVVRAVMVAITLAAGFGAGAAMGVTVASALLGVLIPFLALRAVFQQPATTWRPRVSMEEFRQLVPVVGGLLAITALSTDDLLVAKAAFSQAGVYGSASLLGRAILYLTAAVVTVLLPKVSQRAAASQDTSSIVGRSIFVTAAFGACATLFYAAFGEQIVRLAFGAKYEAAAGLLWMFGIAMTGYAVLNVLLTYHIGLGASRMSWLLLIGAVAQVALFAVFHDTARELLWTSIVSAGGLIVAHELVVEPTLARLVRRGVAAK
jgi:O-antigen/teichoic acid export membrane protein